MRLSITREEFSRAAKHAAMAANAKGTMPILASVLLRASGDTLTITGTDLYTTTTAEAACDTEAPGQAAVNAGDLLKRIDTLPVGMVHVETKDASLVIKAGSRRHVLPTSDADAFPPQDYDAAEWQKVNGAAIRDALTRAKPAASLDQTRSALHGVFVESEGATASFVGCDSHRLHVVKRELALPGGGILPLAAIGAIVRVLEAGEAEIAWSKSSASVRAGGLSVSTKLVQGQFPPYQQVVPQANAYTATVERGAFASAVKAVIPAMDDKAGGIKLTFFANTIALRAEDAGKGEASDTIDCVGGPGDAVEIGANAKYLLDALDAMGGDDVEIGFSGARDPIVIRPVGNQSVTIIVMPMRVK